MRLPRDVDGEDLIRRLRRRGYQAPRRVGGHVRLTATVQAQGREPMEITAVHPGTFDPHPACGRRMDLLDRRSIAGSRTDPGPHPRPA